MAEYFAHILRRWFLEGGKYEDGNYWGGIWADLEKEFNELMERLKTDTTEVAALCSEIDKSKTIMENVKKEMCKTLIRIKFFMSGIKGKGKAVDGQPEIEQLGEVESYFRCIIGSMTMVKLYKGHCKLDEIAKWIMEPARVSLEARKLIGAHEKCKDLPFSGMKIGANFIGNKVNGWLEKKKNGTQMYGTIMNNTGCQKGKQEESKKGMVELLGRNDESELQEFADSSNNLASDKLEEVLKKVGDRMKKKKTPYECPGSTSTPGGSEDKEELGIEEWFTTFSRSVSSTDKDYYKELESMLDICDQNETLEGDVKLEKYKDFCKVMVRNVMLVTDIENQHKTDQTKCKNTVKDIPLCELLRVWMYYMNAFCVPKAVIEHALQGVKAVRGNMDKDKNYAECSYDGVLNIPERKGNDMRGELYELFETNIMLNKIIALTNRKWCQSSTRHYRGGKAPGDPKPARDDSGAGGSTVVSSPELKKLKNTIKKIEEEVKKEVEAERKLLEDALQEAIAENNKQASSPPPNPSSSDALCTDGDLCTRVKCVSGKWHQNKGHTNGVKWSNMESDISSSGTKMFEHISTIGGSMEGTCNRNTEKHSRIVTDPERRTCQYISAGLQYIYGINIADEGKNQQKGGDGQKAKDNRDFKQTMMCLLLNAYANKLKQEVKSPCKIEEETIKQSFQRGNNKLTSWCKDRNNGKVDCLECKREDYSKCTINDKEIKDEVEELLQRNNRITQTLSTLNDINKNLCQRAQCVTTQWKNDKREEKKGTTVWEKDIWDYGDMQKILNALYDAMKSGNTTEEPLCNNINGQSGKTETESEKKACNYIVKGIKHVYSIKEDPKGTDDQHKKNYKRFKQTMACLILNEYGKLLGEKPCIGMSTIKNAFTAGENVHNGNECTEEPCEKCTWDECSNFTIRPDNQRQKIKKKLLEKNEIQETLDSICPKPPPPPPIPPPTPRSEDSGIPPPEPAPAAAAPKIEPTAVLVPPPGAPQPGKSTEPSSSTPRGKECNDLENNTDHDRIFSCLEKSNSQSVPDNSNVDDRHEANRGTGPLGEKGTNPAVVDIKTITASVISGPGPTITVPESQTPSTGTDTQTPSGDPTSSDPSSVSEVLPKDPGNNNKRKNKHS
ncbi:SICA antigen [Plasmodium coatneyi]|uniref:SICA antigen n=1 Tax=Plasmodium coatneyi TaxID=208452 RepID=A0A1B1DT91_9APIC|nr:SICA antigen [Plasmodium coatneyi]ANQ05805.1 SICA antigen [Plasmodium coatneyi]